MRRTLLLLLAFPVFLALAFIAIWIWRPTLPFGQNPVLGFITQPGKHVVLSDAREIRIYEQNGRLNYRVWYKDDSGSGTMGPTNPGIKPDTDWFAYVESRDRYWIYDGEDGLKLVEVLPKRMKTSSIERARDRLVREMPPAVRARLPHTVAEPSDGSDAATPSEGDTSDSE